MKIFKIVCSLAMALSLTGGIEAVSIKEAREAGKLRVKNNEVVYDGLLHLTWKLDSWEGIVELARDYPHLTDLHLWNNKLTSLPREIGQLKNLQMLLLGGNKLTSLPPEIGQLKNLQRLGLRDNKLTSLPPEMVQLRKLEKLYLGGNRLDDRAVKILAKMKWLEYLTLDHTKLSLKQRRWIKKQLPNTRVLTGYLGPSKGKG